MSDDENKYRQLAIFGTIVAEVVITPSAFGGVAFYFLRGSTLQPLIASIAAVLGLVVAFYRIALLRKRVER